MLMIRQRLPLLVLLPHKHYKHKNQQSSPHHLTIEQDKARILISLSFSYGHEVTFIGKKIRSFIYKHGRTHLKNTLLSN